LIEECEQRGYQAYWSCDADHTASIRVAQKLGFQHKHTYQIIEKVALDERRHRPKRPAAKQLVGPQKLYKRTFPIILQ
jgi:hypothetical protein